MHCPAQQDWATLTSAFASMIGGQRRPTYLQTDKESEFLNCSFQKLLAENDIKFFSSENEEIKAAVVERFNRTLKTFMYGFFTWSSLYRFADVFQDLIDSYNGSYQRSINMAPINVNNGNEDEVGANLYPLKQPQPICQYPFISICSKIANPSFQRSQISVTYVLLTKKMRKYFIEEAKKGNFIVNQTFSHF